MAASFEYASASYRAREPALSTLVNHNIIVGGRRTSVRLEPVMWESLHEIARRRGVTLHSLVTEINEQRSASSLTAAIRVYIVHFYRAAAAATAPGEGDTPTPWPRLLPM